MGGKRHMLFLAAGIGKAQINEFDFVVLDHFKNINYRHIFLQTGIQLFDKDTSQGAQNGNYISTNAVITSNESNIMPRV
jgi:hypothetical protein